MTAPSQPNLQVMTIEGDVDLARIAELDGLIGDSKLTQGAFLVFDLTPVTFMDSSGLNWLLRTEAGLSGAGGSCALVVPDGPLAKLFNVSGLESHFRIHRTMGELAEID